MKEYKLCTGKQRGMTMIEIVVVISIMLVVAGFAIPNIIQAVYNLRLVSGAGSLAMLMQQARILAAKRNATYPIRYTTVAGLQEAYVDVNGNGRPDAGELLISFPGNVVPASGAPSGGGGQPPPYTSSSDTGTGYYDNTATLAFSPRGLPCYYDGSTTPPTCTTPAATYFVFYLTDTRPSGSHGWAAVVVTKGGRTKTVRWDGATWH